MKYHKFFVIDNSVPKTLEMYDIKKLRKLSCFINEATKGTLDLEWNASSQEFMQEFGCGWPHPPPPPHHHRRCLWKRSHFVL